MATVRTRSYFTNLFITGYKPSQINYADLFLTVPMKKEVADRARVTTGSASLETEVGLVVLATDANAKANTAQLADRSLVVQPHQLPTVVAIANATSQDMPTTVLESVADVSVTTRNKYDVRPTATWVTWLLSRLFKSGGTAGQVPVKTDGTDYNWGWSTLTIAETSGTVPINRGGTGQTTANAALNALLPAQTVDMTIVSNGTSVTFAPLPIAGGGTGQVTASAARVALLPSLTGNALEVLRVNAGETDVEFATVSAGDTYKTTSSDSLAIATGSKSFTVAAGLAWQIGVRCRATSAGGSSNFMEGNITSYSGTTLIMTVDTIGGSGTLSDWNINIGGVNSSVWIASGAVVSGDIASIANLDYKLDGAKVSFRGSFTFDAAIASSTHTIFTLPTGFIPPNDSYFPVVGIMGTTHKIAYCKVTAATGVVTVVLPTPATDFNSGLITLENIGFFII